MDDKNIGSRSGAGAQPLLKALALCKRLTTLSIDAATLAAPGFALLLSGGTFVDLAVAGAIRELHVFNAMAQGTVTLFCSALKGSGIEAFHFVPHFASDAQLDHHSVQADAVLEALGGCSHLAALSVNMACMDAGLSTHVLDKGGIVQLTVDLNHHDADIVLPRGLIEAVHFNGCILKCVGANASLKEIALDSDLPLRSTASSSTMSWPSASCMGWDSTASSRRWTCPVVRSR
jgi:hypothetical protein